MGAEVGVQNMCMEMAAEMAGKMALGAQMRTQLPVYFWFTSGLLLVYFQEVLESQMLDRWCHWTLDPIFFFILMVFHLYFKGFSFLSQFTSGNASENLSGTSGTRTSAKCKNMNFQ